MYQLANATHQDDSAIVVLSIMLEIKWSLDFSINRFFTSHQQRLEFTSHLPPLTYSISDSPSVTHKWNIFNREGGKIGYCCII